MSYAVIGGDAIKTNDNVLVTEPELRLTTGAAGTLEIEVTLFVKIGGGGLQIRLNSEDGLSWTAIRGVVRVFRDNENQLTNNFYCINLAVYNQTIQVTELVGDQATIIFRLLGKIDDPGTVVVQWAQINPNPAATVIYRNSYIHLIDTLA